MPLKPFTYNSEDHPWGVQTSSLWQFALASCVFCLCAFLDYISPLWTPFAPCTMRCRSGSALVRPGWLVPVPISVPGLVSFQFLSVCLGSRVEGWMDGCTAAIPPHPQQYKCTCMHHPSIRPAFTYRLLRARSIRASTHAACFAHPHLSTHQPATHLF